MLQRESRLRRVNPKIAAFAAVSAICASTALFGGCGAPQSQSGQQIDLAAEQELLFACAVEEVAARVEVALADDTQQLVLSRWELRANERVRSSIAVVMDPWYGPGINVTRVRQRRGPAPEGVALTGDGYYRVRPTVADRQYEEELADEVRRCWQGRRE